MPSNPWPTRLEHVSEVTQVVVLRARLRDDILLLGKQHVLQGAGDLIEGLGALGGDDTHRQPAVTRRIGFRLRGFAIRDRESRHVCSSDRSGSGR
jgi:hypothetical protein